MVRMAKIINKIHMTNKKLRKIIMIRGGVERLAQRFNCNRLTVRLALDGSDSSELRKEIRRAAIEEMGGVYARL